MKSTLQRLNKRKLFALKESGRKFIDSTSTQVPHQVLSAALLADSLDGIVKEFRDVAYVGENPHLFLQQYKNDSFLERIFICSSNEQTLDTTEKYLRKYRPYLEKHFVVCEEELWPMRPDTLDLVVSDLTLHQCEDTGVVLSRILDSLRPDGMLLGHAYGARTLEELKSCMFLAENERSGGYAAHGYRTEEIAALGNRLDKIGYKLTSFTEKDLTEEYADAYHLMDFLSRTGQGYAGASARTGVLKDLFIATSALYQNLFGRPYVPAATEEAMYTPEHLEKLKGRTVVPATFHLIQFVGWKHDPNSQQQPAPRGTGDLQEFVDEISKDEPELKDRIKFGAFTEAGELSKPKPKNSDPFYNQKVKYGYDGPKPK